MIILAFAAIALLLITATAFAAILAVIVVFVLISLIRPSRDTHCETKPLVRPEALPTARTHRSPRSA
jgi:hypothetical protein